MYQAVDRMLVLVVFHVLTQAAVFQKIIYVPKPDYGSRCILWRNILITHGAQISAEFDISSLAKITGTYPVYHKYSNRFKLRLHHSKISAVL